MGIPKLNEEGVLPPGEHEATLDEIGAAFGYQNERRQKLMQGLREAALSFAQAGVSKIWVDGSFVTSKEEPQDIDGCWEYSAHINLGKIDPVFLMRERSFMKEKYGMDFFPSSLMEGESELPIFRFFQKGRNQESKGILVVRLEGIYD